MISDYILLTFDQIFASSFNCCSYLFFKRHSYSKNHVAVYKTGVYYLKSIICFRWHRNKLWNKRRENDGQLRLILFNWCPTFIISIKRKFFFYSILLWEPMELAWTKKYLNIPNQSWFMNTKCIHKVYNKWLYDKMAKTSSW